MELKEKLAEVVRFYAAGSQRELCRATGITPTALNKMLAGTQKVSPRYISLIGDVFPDARAYLEGRMELPRTSTVQEAMAEKDAEIARLRAEIALKNRVIEALLDRTGTPK